MISVGWSQLGKTSWRKDSAPSKEINMTWDDALGEYVHGRVEVLETGLNSAALWKGATGLCQLHFAHTSVSVGTQVTLVSALSRSPCHSCWMTTSPSCSTSICGTSGCKGQECLREFPVPWLLLFCLLFESPWLLLEWLYKKKKKKKRFHIFLQQCRIPGSNGCHLQDDPHSQSEVSQNRQGHNIFWQQVHTQKIWKN